MHCQNVTRGCVCVCCWSDHYVWDDGLTDVTRTHCILCGLVTFSVILHNLRYKIKT